MKLQPGNIAFTFIILLMSCSQNNANLEKRLEKEFDDKVQEVNGKKHNIHVAPDWKATAYFKNDRAVLIFEQTMPETGYTSKRIYCDKLGIEIEKIVYRRNLPNWQKNSSELCDSIFIVLPKQNIVESYYENELVNSSKNISLSERILKDAEYVKSQVEGIHNGR